MRGEVTAAKRSISRPDFIQPGRALEVVVMRSRDFPALRAQAPGPRAARPPTGSQLVTVLERFARSRRQVLPKLPGFIDHVKSRSEVRQTVILGRSVLRRSSAATSDCWRLHSLEHEAGCGA